MGKLFLYMPLESLHIGSSNMTGPIPDELANLENLRKLWVWEMPLTRADILQLENLTQVDTLYLLNNQWPEQLPSEIGRLTSLIELNLFNDELTGTIPPEIGNLKKLSILRLTNTNLSGPIPPEIGNLASLDSLAIWGNNLTGPLPSELGKLTNLRSLTIINEPEMTGPIPPTLGNLARLERLSMVGNYLNGAIPSELGNLTNLRSLILARNELTGPIPPQLENLRNLQILQLAFNNLTDAIPSELGNLGNLRILILRSNQLTGPIPSELGRLRNLNYLTLGFNELTGSIPPELGRLQNLDGLILSNNALSGSIPPELGDLITIGGLEEGTTFYLGGPHGRLDLANNRLTGSVPATLGNLTNLTRLSLSHNQLTGALPMSLIQLNNLTSLTFDSNLSLCSPEEQAFQDWLATIDNVMGSKICSVLSFSSEVSNQSYPLGIPISPLKLPEVTTGFPPYKYFLNLLDLPLGLQYNFRNVTISGTPTQVTPPVPFTYTVTDASDDQDSLKFSIEVYSGVATQQDALPETLVLQANYPNPFVHSTHLVMDLPWPAQVQVEVMDVMGRRVMQLPSVTMNAGWAQTIEMDGSYLPAGLYLYRVVVEAPASQSIHVGHFARVR